MPANALLIDDEDIFVGRSNTKRHTALVIDGDPLVARSLAMMFEAQAFAVDTASAGAAGLRLAGERPFDLIILGADLPDMSGLDAMKSASASRRDGRDGVRFRDAGDGSLGRGTSPVKRRLTIWAVCPVRTLARGAAPRIDGSRHALET